MSEWKNSFQAAMSYILKGQMFYCRREQTSALKLKRQITRSGDGDTEIIHFYVKKANSLMVTSLT